MLEIFLRVLLLYFCIPSGEGIKCYYCYESSSRTLLASFMGQNYSSKDLQCDKDKSKWNTLDCPPEYPICVLASASSQTETEILRTCASRGVCGNLQPPPPGIKIDYCSECTTDLCNDYPRGSVSGLNVNINLLALFGLALWLWY